MVALVIAAVGSFVSCKDYDDDINNLQKQIDNAALKSSVEALQSTLDSKITAAQNAAAAAQTAADKAAATANAAVTKAQLDDAISAAKTAAATAANEYADKVATAAQTAAAKEAYDQAKAYTDAEVAKVTAAIPSEAAIKAIADASAAALDEALATELKAWVNEQIDAIDVKGQVDAAVADAVSKIDTAAANVAAIWSAVTSVELIGSLGANYDTFVNPNLAALDLYFFHGKEVDNEFGPEGDTHTYVADKDIDAENPILVRVNPINATFTKEQVKLINSKGEDFEGFYEVVSVEPYEKLITRAGSKSGLWKIVFKGNPEKTDAEYAKETLGKGNVGKVLYAVSIANVDEEADRQVASTYDLGVIYGEYVAAADFDFKVDEESVANIHNRWDGNKVIAEDGTVDTKKSAYELKWIAEAADAQGKATKNTKADGTGATVPAVTPAIDGADAVKNAVKDNTAAEKRSGKPLYTVALNSPFVINSFDFGTNVAGDVAFAQYYFVTLDLKNAIESNPSEKNIWPKYTIEGLDELVSVKEGHEITVTDPNAVGDILGFRVYVVNFDGTLADPDGKAFYVQVGKTTQSTVEDQVVTIDGTKKAVTVALVPGEASAPIAIDGATLFGDDATTEGWVAMEKIENPAIYSAANSTAEAAATTAPFTVTFYKKADGTDVTTSLKEARSYKITYDPQALIDGATYTRKYYIGYLTNVYAGAMNKVDTLKYYTFNVTKALPTQLPAKAKVELRNGIGENNVVTLYPDLLFENLDGDAAAPATNEKGASVSLANIFKAPADAEAVANAKKTYLLFANTDSTHTVSATGKITGQVRNASTGALAGSYKYDVNYASGKAFLMGKAATEKKDKTFNDVETQNLIIRFANKLNGSTHRLYAAYDFGTISREEGKVATTYWGGANTTDRLGNPTSGVDTGIDFIYKNWADALTWGLKPITTKSALTNPATPAVVESPTLYVNAGEIVGGISPIYYDRWNANGAGTAYVYSANEKLLAGGGIKSTSILAQNTGKIVLPAAIANKTLDEFLTAGSLPAVEAKFALTAFGDAAAAWIDGTFKTVYVADDEAGNSVSSVYEVTNPDDWRFNNGTANPLTIKYIGSGSVATVPSKQYIIIKAFDWFYNATSMCSWNTAGKATNLHTVKIAIPIEVRN